MAAHPCSCRPNYYIALSMAKLEWAEIESFDGAEHDRLTPEDIASIDPNSSLHLQPHLRFVEAAHGVDSLILEIREFAKRHGGVPRPSRGSASSEPNPLTPSILPSIALNSWCTISVSIARCFACSAPSPLAPPLPRPSPSPTPLAAHGETMPATYPEYFCTVRCTGLVLQTRSAGQRWRQNDHPYPRLHQSLWLVHLRWFHPRSRPFFSSCVFTGDGSSCRLDGESSTISPRSRISSPRSAFPHPDPPHSLLAAWILGGLLLILGLGSRFTGLVLTGNMFVAYITADREALLSIFSNPGKFYGADPYTFLFAAVLILILGPGSSLSTLFWRIATHRSALNQSAPLLQFTSELTDNREAF